MGDIMTERSGTRGAGFLSLLTLVFITLKLTGEIDWSWWWVLSPLWIPFVIFLLLLLFLVGVVRTLK